MQSKSISTAKRLKVPGMPVQRTVLFLVMMELLSVAPFIPLSGNSAPPDAEASGLKVRTEWEDNSQDMLINDTDGDGKMELLCWDAYDVSGEMSWQLRAYEFPGYRLANALNFTGSISVRPFDLGQNGSTQLLVRESVPKGQRYSVVSGRSLQVLWSGPVLNGTLMGDSVCDVDADGTLEMVWLNRTLDLEMVYNDLWVFDAVSFAQEWHACEQGSGVYTMLIANVDLDPQPEILIPLFCGHMLSAIDVKQRAIQWNTSDEYASRDPLLYVGDADADRAVEIVSLGAEGYSQIGERVHLCMISGANGSYEWNCVVGNKSAWATVLDLDADGAMEVVGTGSLVSTAEPIIRHFVIDLQNRTELWGRRDNLYNKDYDNGEVLPIDLNGDGVLELVYAKSTSRALYSYDLQFEVYDGRTLKMLNQFPLYHYWGYDSWRIWGSDIDGDGKWETVLSMYKPLSDGANRGMVIVFSSESFEQEWASEEFPYRVTAGPMDVDGDRQDEIQVLLSNPSDYHYLFIDGEGYGKLWESPSTTFVSSMLAANLTGDNKTELFILQGYIDPRTDHRSGSPAIYSHGSYETLWTGDRKDGAPRILSIGDPDGDGYVEAIMAFDLYAPSRTSRFVVLEMADGVFMPDLALSGSDISVLNASQVAVDVAVELAGRVRNPGHISVQSFSLDFRVDGLTKTTVVLAAERGGLADFSLKWTAVAGDHVLSLRADPYNLVIESNETNNAIEFPINITDYPKPRAVVSAPADGSGVQAGAPVVFDGQNSTASMKWMKLTYEWSSNVCGPLGTGPTFVRTLPAGMHGITLTVDDGKGGRSSSAVVINVTEAAGMAPVISSPAWGPRLEVLRPVVFDASGSVFPQGQNITFEWSSDAGGKLGTGLRVEKRLAAGVHNITLTMTDGNGNHTSTSVRITMYQAKNYAPEAFVMSPSEGASVKGTIVISGECWDDTAPVQLEIRLDHKRIAYISGIGEWNCSWDTKRASNGRHVLGVQASDGTNSSGEYSVNVTVNNRLQTGPVKFIPASGGPSLVATVIIAVVLAAWKRRKQLG